MFNRDNEKINNENIILKGKPNLFLSCKKVFVLFIILGALSYTAPLAINYIIQMQVYLIRYINLPLTQIATITTFLLTFLIIFWIIWTLVSWTAKEYIISDHRITHKSGILFQKTIHMPYAKVQDVVVSQGILGKIVSVGTVTAYSGYDGSKLELNNISNPKKVEEIIFNELNKLYSPYPNQSLAGNQGGGNNPTTTINTNFNNTPNNYNNQFNSERNYSPEPYTNSDNYINQDNYGNYDNQSIYNPYDNEENFEYNETPNINHNINNDSKIKDRYTPQHEIDEEPRRRYNPINDNDFPFLKKDKAHDVNDYVENPDEYKNSSTFLDDNLDSDEDNNQFDISSGKDSGHVDNERSHNSDYNSFDGVDGVDSFDEDNIDSYDYADENDYLDQTMSKAMNNLDDGIKFKNTYMANDKVDNDTDFYNQNQKNQYQQQPNINQNNSQRNYNQQNPNIPMNNQPNYPPQNNNYQNPNQQQYNQQNYQQNHNPQNNNYQNPNQQQYNQQQYNQQQYNQQNHNQQNYNQQNGNNQGMNQQNYNQQNVNNQGMNQQKKIQNKNVETKKDKSKEVLERHFKKFKK